MTINSRNKGVRAELEAAHFLTELGIPAYRSQQYKGSGDSADVRFQEAALNGVTHIEVKRDERLNVYEALCQAKRDASDSQTPIVMHRKNHEPWMVTIDAVDFWEMFRGWWHSTNE